MIAVITGGTSFVGAALLRQLLSSGTTCYVIVRPDSQRLSMLPKHERVRIVKSELDDAERWMQMIPGCDVFYHFAWDGVGAEGRANPLIQDRNVAMAITCLKAAALLGVKRFLFAGSQAEYGLCDGPIMEDRACEPVIEYGKGKLRFFHAAEALCNELGIEYVHMRIFSVYGPGDHPWTLVSRCIDGFLNHEELALSTCEQPWNFLHVEDAGCAMARLADCELKGHRIINIAGLETAPLKTYVDVIWKTCNQSGKPAYGKYRNGIEKVHGIEPVIDRLLDLTGWRPQISFSAGIRDLVDKHRS